MSQKHVRWTLTQDARGVEGAAALDSITTPAQGNQFCAEGVLLEMGTERSGRIGVNPSGQLDLGARGRLDLGARCHQATARPLAASSLGGQRALILRLRGASLQPSHELFCVLQGKNHTVGGACNEAKAFKSLGHFKPPPN